MKIIREQNFIKIYDKMSEYYKFLASIFLWIMEILLGDSRHGSHDGSVNCNSFYEVTDY